MEEKLKGTDNEFMFVKKWNCKKLKELDPLCREFMDTLFKNISEDAEIKSWRNHYPQKTDVFIKIENRMKGISIKMGSRNSIHMEPISHFVKFLKEIGIEKEIVEKYLYYHFADGTIDGTGKERLSKEKYLKEHQEDIDIINQRFNNKKILKRIIDRFVLYGRNSTFPIDAIVHGTKDDFLWLTEEEIIKVIMNYKLDNSTGVHFGPLFCQPQNRCLNRNSKYEGTRYNVQIKWYSLLDDIIIYKNKKIESSLEI